MSDTNRTEKVSTGSFLWEYHIDRGELEDQLERQVSGEEWYSLMSNLDDAIAGILSAL
jgi:hypothetical protein